jgi:antitoxin CcdA
MTPSAKPKKKAVNLSIDARLAAEAKSFGTNLSATLEKALHQEHGDKRAEKWRKDNREEQARRRRRALDRQVPEQVDAAIRRLQAQAWRNCSHTPT